MYRTLAAVFAAQIIMFGAAAATCFSRGGLEQCPEIGRRFESTFASITATILALLADKPESI